AASLIDHEGLTIQQLDLPIDLEKGIARTVYHDKPDGQNLPQPASCNGGTIDLGGVEIDLTGDVMTVSMPKTLIPPEGRPILTHVSLNPALVSPDTAQGLLDVQVLDLEKLAVTELTTPNAKEKTGRAQLKLSITQLAIGNPMISQILGYVGGKGSDHVTAEVKDGTVTIENGEVTQNITLAIDNHPMTFNGGVNLASRTFQNFNIDIPTSLMGKLVSQLPAQARQFVPENVPLSLTGP